MAASGTDRGDAGSANLHHHHAGGCPGAGARRRYATAQTYHQAFQHKAAEVPDRLAVVDPQTGEALSFAELVRRSDQLGRRLRGRGHRGTAVPVIALFLERSIALAVAPLAIWKAGAAYLPLDPDYPRDRIALLLADSGASMVLTTSRLAPRLPPSDADVIRLDEELKSIETGAAPTPPQAAAATADAGTDAPPAILTETSPDQPAYLIYTSGSTGRPKGVMISHRNLLNHNFGVIEAYGLRADDRFLQFASISFDISIEEIFPSWLLGAPVILRSSAAASSIPALLDLVHAHAITVLNLPTAYWHELVHVLDDRPLPESVRLVVIGGEAASTGHYQHWLERVPQRVELINAYGPTETTVTATYYRTRRDEPDGLLPIGRPLPNLHCQVVAPNGKPVPPGAEGELLIGGAGVGLGYLNRPGLTARVFEPDPDAATAGARRYRTGDRVRCREDGELLFLGRLDEQIKWRGFRIEPDEIRLALTRQPGVADAIAVLREDAPGGPALTAYCVPLADQRLQPKQLASALAEQLPAYMLPSSIRILPQLPMTPNGKVDRRALPMPEPVASAAAGQGDPQGADPHEQAPLTPTEREVLHLWSRIFERDDLDASSDFIALGGHSLIGARLAYEIERELGVSCSVPDLMREGSIRALAHYLEQARAHSAADAAIEVQPHAGAPIPLTRAQKRLWFLWQYQPDTEGLYAVPLAYQLRGKLDLKALRDGLVDLVARHDVLRMRFRVLRGEPHAELVAPLPIELEPSHVAPHALLDSLWAEAKRPFDLSAAPPWRVCLLRLSETEHVLALTQHHIITDGHSVARLGAELARAYAERVQGRSPDWPPLPVSFADYAWWQQPRETAEALAPEIQHWRETLTGYVDLDLPTDAPRPPKQGFRGAVLRFTLDAPLTQALHRFAGSQGATLFMVLLTGYQALLERYSGQQDFVVGVPVANRPRPELQDVLGLFVTTLPLRCPQPPDSSFQERLARTKQVCLDAYARQETPLDLIIEALRIPRDAARAPLFQTLISVLSDPAPSFEAAGISATEIPLHGGASLLDLSLYFEDSPTEISGYAEFNADLFSSARIERMVLSFKTLLRRAVEQPEQPLEQLELLPQPERQLLLCDWNATERDYPLDRLLHQLIDEQAERTPNGTAAIFGDQSISYAELRHRSDQLAAHLDGLGIRPGDLVGLCLTRSLDMLIALLGVLKTGAAYVPLDPDFPASRLAYMVENANAALILTESEVVESLPALEGRPRLLLDQAREVLYAGSEAPPAIPADPESLAYVIHTSGSTGKPKGVQIPHRAVVNFLLSMRERPGLTAEDRVLALTTLSFDIAVLELYLPLITGAAVVLTTRADARDSFQLIERLKANPVSLIQATPATYRMLLDANWKGDPGLKILSGGEPLPPDLAERLLARGKELWNMYGPTETTVWSAIQQVENPEAPISIGRPIANTQLYILDPHRNPVPVGAVGELWIGGSGTATGYLNRPDLTEERFIPNPFSADGGLIYNTGDLARYRADGRVDCLGRADFQVKISGHRLELGEIEGALKGCPEIEDAVVMAVDAEGGGKRLAAYYIAAAGADRGTDRGATSMTSRLRAALMESLPDYAIPGIFVALDRFPLTPNGKVDRKALPAPGAAAAPQERELVPPYTPEQEALCEAYEQVLQRHQVSIKDNFFELGGDSLRAIQVIDRLHHRGLELRVESMFRYDTVEELATVITSRHTGSDDRRSSGIEDCLVTLRDGDPTRFPPLFLVHSPPGDLLGYGNLVQALDADQPVFGFQSRGLFDPDAAQDSIEGMAADYCRLIERHFPDTPFSLAGWCLGGSVAYEMAHQLRAIGRPPALLAVFDTFGLAPRRLRMVYYLGKLVSMILVGPKGWLPYAKAKIERQPDPDQALGFRQDAELEHVGIFANRALVREKNMAAIFAYRSKHYGGDLLVFPAAVQDPTKLPGLFYGWRTLVKRLKIVIAPGEHNTMLKPPHVEQLANLLGPVLQRVAEGRDPLDEP